MSVPTLSNHAPEFPACSPALPRQVVQTTSTLMAVPFDLARESYASAVRAGLIQRSLLGSARFGQMLNALELVTLGPWARRR